MGEQIGAVEVPKTQQHNTQHNNTTTHNTKHTQKHTHTHTTPHPTTPHHTTPHHTTPQHTTHTHPHPTPPHHHHQAQPGLRVASGNHLCRVYQSTSVEVDGGMASAARRMRERRMRSWFRHEQQSIRMVLVTASHHSFDRVHAEHAAPRSQRTGTRSGEGEVFESREAPRGQNTLHPWERPAPLFEEWPQGPPEWHTGVGFELLLDPVVQQMAEQLVEVVDIPVQGGVGLCGGLQGPGPEQGSAVQVCGVPVASARVVESIAHALAGFHLPASVVASFAPAPAFVSSASACDGVFLTRTSGISFVRASGGVSCSRQRCSIRQLL